MRSGLFGSFFACCVFLGLGFGRCRCLGLGSRFLHRCLVGDLLVCLGLGYLQRAFGTGLALELLPVAGDLQNGGDSLGRLRAYPEPVLNPLRVHANNAGVLERLVDADFFNRAAVTSRSRIRDDDAVLGCVDLAHALQLDLDCHGWLLS